MPVLTPHPIHQKSMLEQLPGRNARNIAKIFASGDTYTQYLI
uniref:Uncharacterized protein n=1 Tax=[Tolypothrix] sp. PCC 7415 TaxID=373957 RepID=A0A2P0ZG91_9CYAN|nr:hypothetical protein [[Tolypothrix] sp. PCC 7415]